MDQQAGPALVYFQEDGPTTLCQCRHLLGPQEFLISEVPVMDQQGRYLSVNDESYKAIMELLHYPLDNAALITVAFAELAYVYNADALEIFLAARGFQLLLHKGFMNSDDYPGYRDSQYFVARRANINYLVIRGTSGAFDLTTSVDAEVKAPSGPLNVHGAYGDVSSHIMAAIGPLLATSTAPWIVTGHSLGGSLSILVSLLMANDGYQVTSINYAPAPAVGAAYRQATDAQAQRIITNNFLENEELDIEQQSDQFSWLYLAGAKMTLPDVGKTAGAAHFVINYLKSQLLVNGFSDFPYGAGLPHCVVVKYACFTGSRDGFIPECALYDDSCLAASFHFLAGFTPPAAGAAAGLPVQLLINRDNLRLVEQNLDPVQTAVTMSRLVYLQLLAGEYGFAAAMQAQVEKHYPLQAGIRTGLVGLNRVLLAKHRG
jgi:hypothetical protein